MSIKAVKKIIFLFYVGYFTLFAGLHVVDSTPFCNSSCCQDPYRIQSCHHMFDKADGSVKCHKQSFSGCLGCDEKKLEGRNWLYNYLISFAKPSFHHMRFIIDQTYLSSSRQIIALSVPLHSSPLPLFLQNSILLL